MRHVKPIFIAMSAAAVLAGCAAPQSSGPSQSSGPYSGSTYSQGSMYGVVDRIEVVKKGDSSNIAGMVIGGIVGGLIGHQIGGGVGNTVATIAGAAGGAAVGHNVENRTRAENETFRVSVRMDDGVLRVVTQDNFTDLRPGDRVRVDGNTIYRV